MKQHSLVTTLILAACMSGLLTSCMTIFTGHSDTILISRSTTEPVTIVTADDTLTTSDNPARLSVRKKHLNRPIRLTSESRDYQPFIPGRRIDWLGAYFDLYSYGIGLIVDFNSSAIYHPAQKSYYVQSVPRDSSAAPLPTADHRAPSAFKPRQQQKHYRHELRLSACLGNAMNKGSYQRMYDRACQTLGAEAYDDWYCGIGATVNSSASLAYYYHFDERWAAGLIAGTGRQPYEELGLPLPPKDAHDDFHPQQYIGDMLATSWYFLPTVKYHWAFLGSCRLYAKAAVGAMSQHNWFQEAEPIPATRQLNRRSWHFAYQLSPVALEVGRRHLRSHVELGYGMEGVLNLGVSLHF